MQRSKWSPSFTLAERRIRSLDLYRGVAVLLMIVAHVCDAFLAERWKSSAVWSAMNATFGFVAPAFLGLSGMAMWLASGRRSDRAGGAHPPLQAEARGDGASSYDRSHTSDPPLAPSHLRRFAHVLALAVWLQIPLHSLRQLVWNREPEHLARLFDINVLHVVALGGFLLLGVTRLVWRSPPLQRVVALVLGVAAVVTSPYLWHWSAPEDLPLLLRAIAASQPHATFPLLPFIAFPLIGFALAPYIAGDERRRTTVAVLGGAALIAVGVLLDMMVRGHAVHGDYWQGSIQLTLVRLGGVGIGLGGAIAVASWLGSRRTLLERIGQRSLAVYVLHLMLVYGSPVSMGARYWLGGRFNGALDPLAVATAAIVVTLVTSGGALGWHRFRQRHPSQARLLWWGWWLTFAAVFLTVP